MPAPALLSEPAMVRATGGLADMFEDGPPAFVSYGVASRRATTLPAVGANGFDRAAFHRFLAERFLLRTFRLLVNERMAAVVVSFVIGGRCFAAEITVDTLVIDIERSRDVFRIFVCWIGHISPAKSEMEGRKKALPRKGNLSRQAACHLELFFLGKFLRLVLATPLR